MKIGLSLLCEQPDRKTGLSSLFTCFVREALANYPDLEVVLFCADGQQLEVESERLVRAGGYPANDRLALRLVAEHFRIGPAARDLGCEVLLTTGLVPIHARLPVAMHMLTLHHLKQPHFLTSDAAALSGQVFALACTCTVRCGVCTKG